MGRGKRAVLLVAGSVAAACLLAAAPVKNRVLVQTEVIELGELKQSLWLNGQVRYMQEHPYVSLKNGTVSEVLVQPGERVDKGELLIRLDVSEEAQALSVLYGMQYENKQAQAYLEAAAVPFGLYASSEQEQLRTQLQKIIESSQIRAASDGVMEAVYVRRGDAVNAGTVLGVSRGMQKGIVLSAQADSLSPMTSGMKAFVRGAGQQFGAAVSAVEPVGENGLQAIWLQPEEASVLNNFEHGDTLHAEVVTGVNAPCALVPLTASDAEGDIWIVKDGRLIREAFEWQECSQTHACGDAEWAGRRVVLYPEMYDLKDGMAVRVTE